MRAEHLERARQHYQRAAALDPDNLAAGAGHAATYLLEGEDPSRGLLLVTAAYRQMPGSLRLQLLFAELEARRGNHSPALLHATDVASRGRDQPIADQPSSCSIP